MEIKMTVSTPNGLITFQCTARLSQCRDDLLLEHDFYSRFGSQGIPSGDHYELELEKTPWLPEGRHQIHIHHSQLNDRNFVCWPNPLPTIEKATEVFRVWCIGTAYTLNCGESFNPLFKGDVPAFLEHMRSFGIKIEQEEIS